MKQQVLLLCCAVLVGCDSYLSRAVGPDAGGPEAGGPGLEAGPGTDAGGTGTDSGLDQSSPDCPDGGCVPDPCKGITCASPPPSTCASADELKVYQSSGTCNPTTVKCDYPFTVQSCPAGCAKGACSPDPCAGKSCTTPPAPSCVNATTLKTYHKPGSCSAGKCTYPATQQTCPYGCKSGACLSYTGFTPLTPFRLMDTRDSAMPGSETTHCVKVAGANAIPADAKAVALNIVAVGPTGPGHLTAYPKGVAKPLASTLNYVAGQTIANGAIIKVGSGGEICIFVKTKTDIVIDVQGFFGKSASYFPMTPYRRLDTRITSPQAPIAAKSTTCFQVAGGSQKIPSTAEAVVLNLVAIQPSGVGFLTAYPDGTSRPNTSSLNYAAGEVVANGGIVEVGSSGKICLYNLTATHIVVDISGYFDSGTSYAPLGPKRLYDTRSGSTPAAKSTRCVQIAGTAGVPSNARAVAINLAAVAPAAFGHFTLYPDGHGKPSTSSLNYAAGITRSNNAIVQPGTGGKVCIYTLAAADMVLDVTGYWPGSSTGDPCAGVSCNQPPPDICTGNTAVSYAATGTCMGGTCVYSMSTKTCDYKCAGTTCSTCPQPTVPKASPDPWSVRVPSAGFGGITTKSTGGYTDVFLKSPADYTRIGARLNWGGSIVFFGLSADSKSNVIDAYDAGRELQLALYDPSRHMQGCAYNASCLTGGLVCSGSITYVGWNPVQGGDECNHGGKVLSHGQKGDALQLTVRPMQWNPDWAATTCVKNPCPSQGVPVQVTYTFELRYLSKHVVEVMSQVTSQESFSHPATTQEFPTLYVSNGQLGPDLPLLLTSDGNTVAINTPANDNFFYSSFTSPQPWVSWQTGAKNYGVGLAMDQGIRKFYGWRGDGKSSPYFHNVRASVNFGLGAGKTVRGISYLALGGFATVKAEFAAVLKKRPPFGKLETPAATSSLEVKAKPGDSIAIKGWVLDTAHVGQVTVEIDGKVRAALNVSQSRSDVCAIYPGYSGCPAVGFSGSISTSGLSACSHLMRVRATDADGNSTVLGERLLVLGS